jgi:hypothetical protein
MVLALLVVLAGVPVSGHVVDAESHAPIEGVRVTLAVEQSAFPPTATSGDEAVTDKQGRFVFAIVEPGRYRLDATKKGFAPLSRSAAAPLVDVGDAAIDGLELALTKGAAISGRVVEATGAPQPRLMVSALKIPDPPADLSMTVTAQMTQTDENGEFVLQDLPDGNYLVIAAPGQELPPAPDSPVATVTSATYYPGTASKEAAQIITLAQGQAVADLQFSMVSAHGYQISGTVIDEAGAPVNDAMIMLIVEMPGGGMTAPSIARSNAQGLFHIDGVAAGTYRLMANVATGPNDRIVATGGVFIGGAGAASGIPVSVTDANVSDLRVVIPTRR